MTFNLFANPYVITVDFIFPIKYVAAPYLDSPLVFGHTERQV